MHAAHARTYRSWLVSELVLIALLVAATAALAATDRLGGFALPEARLVLDTAVAVVASMVAVLVAIRFSVEGRVMDLLLTSAFVVVALGTFAYGVMPKLDDGMPSNRHVWAVLSIDLCAAAIVAVAPFVSARVSSRRRMLALALGGAAVATAAIGGGLAAIGADGALVTDEGARAAAALIVFAALAMLALVAAVGFGVRFRRFGRELDSWFAISLTLVVFADLHYVLAPSAAGYVLQGDFLRLLAYAVLLFGVWRAIGDAEFGRAVAEERARVARDIHDGLAQYLFALSTQVSMLEHGAPLEQLLPRLKEASTAAQREARFAVLALSSASGTAPFDAALRRYVDFLTADAVLDVELDIDPAVKLAPDEQIEVFRIVQEGLANARRHADARAAAVSIYQRGGRRVVAVRDDGVGFTDDEEAGAGQGLKNMRRRAASIDGGFTLRSAPGEGTSIEVVLRAA